VTYETILVERRDKGVAKIVIDNPTANTISSVLMEDLEKAASNLSNDPSVRVVVISSNHPKIFVAGADLKGAIQHSGDQSEDDNVIAKQSERMQACLQKFAELPRPVIASINGHALGGGCELALACDFRIMGRGEIGLTELSLGLIPGAGGTQRLTKILGRAKAIELIFTAKKMNASEAYDIGLVHRAVNEEKLEEETMAFAEKLAEGAVNSMGLAKRAINAADHPLEKGLKVEAQAFADTFLTEEPGIGLAAFFQKEKANFIS